MHPAHLDLALDSVCRKDVALIPLPLVASFDAIALLQFVDVEARLFFAARLVFWRLRRVRVK
jgi:hypothetical protein